MYFFKISYDVITQNETSILYQRNPQLAPYKHCAQFLDGHNSFQAKIKIVIILKNNVLYKVELYNSKTFLVSHLCTNAIYIF